MTLTRWSFHDRSIELQLLSSIPQTGCLSPSSDKQKFSNFIGVYLENLVEDVAVNRYVAKEVFYISVILVEWHHSSTTRFSTSRLNIFCFSGDLEMEMWPVVAWMDAGPFKANRAK